MSNVAFTPVEHDPPKALTFCRNPPWGVISERLGTLRDYASEAANRCRMSFGDLPVASEADIPLESEPAVLQEWLDRFEIPYDVSEGFEFDRAHRRFVIDATAEISGALRWDAAVRNHPSSIVAVLERYAPDAAPVWRALERDDSLLPKLASVIRVPEAVADIQGLHYPRVVEDGARDAMALVYYFGKAVDLAPEEIRDACSLSGEALARDLASAVRNGDWVARVGSQRGVCAASNVAAFQGGSSGRCEQVAVPNPAIFANPGFTNPVTRRMNLCRTWLEALFAADYYFDWAKRLDALAPMATRPSRFRLVALLCVRYALYHLVNFAALLVHEYGHRLGPLAHCNRIGPAVYCCQELIARVFQTYLSALLGLPGGLESAMPPTYEPRTLGPRRLGAGACDRGYTTVVRSNWLTGRSAATLEFGIPTECTPASVPEIYGKLISMEFPPR